MNAKNRKLLKIAGIIAGSLVGLMLLVAVLVPLFVDVDEYRPAIVTAANEQINGKLELGKLKLSLWGQVRINVDGFSVKDAKGKSLVSAKDVFFQIPFWSVLIGAPRVNFHLDGATVNVSKDKQGKLNVMELPKSTPQKTVAPEEQTPLELPGIVTRARLGIKMTKATLKYQDLATKLVTKVEDLNLFAKNLSLSSESEVELWADLNTKMDTLTVKGPARLNLRADPKSSGGKFQSARVNLKADLNDLVIDLPDTFRKDKGIEAWASGQFMVTPQKAVCEDLEIRFHNASLKGTGSVTGYNTPPLSMELNVEAPGVEIAPWKKLVAAMKPYDAKGIISVKANAKGPVEKLSYSAQALVKNASFSGGNLKATPQIEAELQVRTNEINKMSLSLKAPKNDLRISGSLKSFTTPKMVVAVRSTGMDLDELISFPKTEASGGGTVKESGAGASAEDVDFDSMLKPVRTNAILKKATGSVDVDIAFLKMMNVPMRKIEGKMTMRKLNFVLNKFGFSVFAGTVGATGNVNVLRTKPTYSLKASASKIDLKQAVKSQFSPFKDTLVGIARFSMDAKGKSFNPKEAKKNLFANGKLYVANAKFNTIDVGRVATEAINKSIRDIEERVPQLKGKTVKAPKAVESEYESVAATFNIKNGEFQAPDFKATAVANRGLDLGGATVVNLMTDALRADWELHDKYNLLKARDMSVKLGGMLVPQVLARDGVVILPIRVSGTVFEPKVSYQRVPQVLGDIALKNIKKAGEQKAKQAIKKEADKLIKKGLKGLFK